MLQKNLGSLELRVGARMYVGLVIAVVLISSTIVIVAGIADETKTLENVEIREYEGKDLSSIDDFFENSIKGPQYMDKETYRLTITGLVDEELEYTYDEVVTSHQAFKKVVTLHCVEGWNVTILWEGVLLKDLMADVGVNPNVTNVIFYAYDGYSTSLPLDYINDKNILMAYKMNNVTLPPERGFPFQLVAESKWGYKWIKWITTIELSDNEQYRGYWESRGYSNEGNLDESFFEGTTPEFDPFEPSIPQFGPLPPEDSVVPEFPSWTILPLFVIVALAVMIYRKKITNKNRS